MSDNDDSDGGRTPRRGGRRSGVPNYQNVISSPSSSDNEDGEYKQPESPEEEEEEGRPMETTFTPPPPVPALPPMDVTDCGTWREMVMGIMAVSRILLSISGNHVKNDIWHVCSQK